MKIKKEFTHNDVSSGSQPFLEYETVEACPICKAKISPVHIACSLDSSEFASVFSLCRGCHNTFITKYSISSTSQKHNGHLLYVANNEIYSEPNRFSKQEFDEKIVSLSPQFDKIFNQSLSAETSGLDEIAGLGYRKALEFLIKDYAIHENPDDKETIKTLPLSQCINSYIEDQTIKTLAKGSAWIGNDEAHYVRKQENRDVSDMKNFIHAIVYFVGMKLVAEDALAMISK